MVEGHGIEGFPPARGMAYADPALFGRLIRTLQDATPNTSRRRSRRAPRR
jgi:uroporphyrinogen decarboxylase